MKITEVRSRDDVLCNVGEDMKENVCDSMWYNVWYSVPDNGWCSVWYDLKNIQRYY